MKPQRIQLQRTKGFNLQEASLALNGLPAVKVDRTTRWGNQFTPTMVCVSKDKQFKQGQAIGVEGAVEAFETWCKTYKRRTPESFAEFIEPLVGKNLACWCKPGAPCHADVLLKVANE